MTEAEEPKERPPRAPPPPPFLTALSGIDVPYGDLWTHFQISSRSGTQSMRPQVAVLYALTSVIWPRGWNNRGRRCTCTCPGDENPPRSQSCSLEDAYNPADLTVVAEAKGGFFGPSDPYECLLPFPGCVAAHLFATREFMSQILGSTL